MDNQSPIIKLLCILIGAVGMLLAINLLKLAPSSDLFVSDIPELATLKFEWKEPQRDTSIDGNSLMIGEKYYQKGLGVHAEAQVSFAVPDGYAFFVAEVGVDDEIKDDSPASVAFEVHGDGALLYKSDTITAAMPPHRIHLNIEGIKQLMLTATNAGDGSNSDHADWGNAKLVAR